MKFQSEMSSMNYNKKSYRLLKLLMKGERKNGKLNVMNTIRSQRKVRTRYLISMQKSLMLHQKKLKQL
jgi:hypothetical protein